MNMLCSILVHKQIGVNSIELCNKSLQIDNEQFVYCQKSKHLSKININDNIVLSQNANSIFIYNDQIVEANIRLGINDVYSFAVFGINSVNQSIIKSVINITILFHVTQGSLVCVQCNVQLKECTLQFNARGQILSTIMIKSLDYLQVINSSVQFRFDGNSCSGLVYQITSQSYELCLHNSQLIGYSFQFNQLNGNIAAQLPFNISIVITNLQICSNINNSNIQLNSLFSCDNICQNEVPVYGLCLKQLLNGQKVENGSYLCIFPFIFQGECCVCEKDYILNGIICVQIINQFNILEEYIKRNVSNIYSQLTDRINNAQNEVEQKISELDIRMYSNISQLLQIIQQYNESATEQLKLLQITINQVNDSGNAQINQLRSDLQSSSVTLSSQMNANRNEILQINSTFNNFAALALKNNTDQNNAINSLQTTVQNLQAQINAVKSSNVVLSYDNDLCGTIIRICGNGICGSFRPQAPCNINSS
ncbi:Hypothetical_protein [Hexamita inflata]|uniref:Hypothetical_protein n=1 Tax=Hexamita inflata TaxID=28002 RepID=A0AA86P1W1_9EUKA|nr:Hypothetical protein HINF_LOCUS17255 [Hexamita inflata]